MPWSSSSTLVHGYRFSTHVNGCRCSTPNNSNSDSAEIQEYSYGTGVVQGCRISTAVHVCISNIELHECRSSTMAHGCRSTTSVHRYRNSTGVPDCNTSSGVHGYSCNTVVQD
jgi:hypothetical protein